MRTGRSCYDRYADGVVGNYPLRLRRLLTYFFLSWMADISISWDRFLGVGDSDVVVCGRAHRGSEEIGVIVI